MSDRDLLATAARAVGMNPQEAIWHPRAGFVWVKRVDGIRTENGWNPLTDDGDALRLAVKLQIDIKQYVNHAVAWFGGGYIGTGRVFYDGDPCAATRRAIVLAAAEIGRDEAQQPADPFSIPSQEISR